MPILWIDKRASMSWLRLVHVLRMYVQEAIALPAWRAPRPSSHVIPDQI